MNRMNKVLHGHSLDNDHSILKYYSKSCKSMALKSRENRIAIDVKIP